MKTFTLTFFLFIIAQLEPVTGQTVEKKANLPKVKGDLNCFYKGKYSALERRKFYPFDIAHKIEIVSFRYHFENYPVRRDSLIVDSLIETAVLSTTDIDTLTDIVFNNFYKGKSNYGVIRQCFFPRNAILFLDKFGNLRESIIICFHCRDYEKSSDKINLGDECNQKTEKMRQLFITKGLKFGTDLTIDLYPGEQWGDPSIPRPGHE